MSDTTNDSLPADLPPQEEPRLAPEELEELIEAFELLPSEEELWPYPEEFIEAPELSPQEEPWLSPEEIQEIMEAPELPPREEEHWPSPEEMQDIIMVSGEPKFELGHQRIMEVRLVREAPKKVPHQGDALTAIVGHSSLPARETPDRGFYQGRALATIAGYDNPCIFTKRGRQISIYCFTDGIGLVEVTKRRPGSDSYIAYFLTDATPRSRWMDLVNAGMRHHGEQLLVVTVGRRTSLVAGPYDTEMKCYSWVRSEIPLFPRVIGADAAAIMTKFRIEYPHTWPYWLNFNVDMARLAARARATAERSQEENNRTCAQRLQGAGEKTQNITPGRQ